MPRHELRLLGGASILGADGRPLAGRATHRHRLALLAVVALARPGGVSRDKLAGLLWPERDEDAARHLLRSALHELRRTLGPAALHVTRTDVRLDADHAPADVHRFEDALDAGDLERAVTLYRGPFLDGLFLDDAQAFDEWAAAHRGQLERRHQDALQALAEGAERRGDPARAAAHWRALAAVRPADGPIAARLIDALRDAGDPVGALAHAAAHVRHLRDEFGVAPDDAIRARIGALRAAAAPSTDEVSWAPDPDAPAAAAGPAPAPDAPTGTPDAAPGPTGAAAAVTVATPSVPRLTHRRGWRTTLAVAAVVAAAALVAWTLRRRAVPADAPEVLAVAPFEIAAGAPAELRLGLADLLATNLDQMAGVRVVPSRVSAARAESLSVRGGSAQELARALGSDDVVTGSVATAAGGGVVVRLALVSRAGTIRTRVEASGPVADLHGLVDRLAVGVLREVWGRRWRVPAPRLAAVSTSSPEALLAYVRGELFLRETRWDSATVALARAVELDSTFALAYLRLAESHGWRAGMGSAPAQQTLAAAARFSNRLPPRERALLTLRALHQAGDLAALDSADALVGRYPDDPESQYVRADVRFHARLVGGMRAARRAAAAFDSAQRVDPRSARVYVHVPELALELGDSVRFDRAVAALAALERAGPEPGTSIHDYALLRVVRWSPPPRAVATLLGRLRTDPPAAGDVFMLVGAVEQSCLGAPVPTPALLLRAYDALAAAYPGDDQVQDLVARRSALLLLGLGRFGAALPRLERLWPVEPLNIPRWMVVPVVLGHLPASSLGALLPAIERAPAWHTTPARRRRAALVRAQVRLARGESGDVPSARRAVHEAIDPRPLAPGDAVPATIRGAATAVEGWARLAEGDTAGALHAMEEGLRHAGYDGALLDATEPVRAMHLRLLASRPERRAEAIDRMRLELELAGRHHEVWWRREMARALDAQGSGVEAAAERRRLAALHAGAEPGSASARPLER